MAPKRKSRSVNRRLSAVNDVSPIKDGANSKTSMQRKRKLSDMLGSQWSKEELERFYEAFRKYGKDWKKVGAAVRNRSVDMVEALYTMNRAYLSLPEGTASVVGLIAMMTDHYCNLEGSDSEQESNDGVATSQKPQKRARGKVRTSTSKAFEGKLPVHSQTSTSNSDCLSLLKKKRTGGSRPWTVGKRTPRFPVSFSYDKGIGGRFLSPTRQGLKPKANANDDDVAHEVALALAGASQRGGSPQESQTPNRRTGGIRSLPVQSGDMMDTELELTSGKFLNNMDDDGYERSVGSMGVGKFPFARDRRRLHGTKSDMDYGVGNHLDDIREASSGTEGQNFGVKVGKFAHISPQLSRKKSKKIFPRPDEGSEFDALQTLADLSLMMPTTSENESSVQAKEEDELTDKYEFSGVKVKKNQDVAKMSKLGKFSGIDSGLPEANEELHQSTSRLSRKKQKIFSPKIPRAELRTDTHLSEPQEVEVVEGGKKLMSNGELPSVSALQQKKVGRHPENSSSSVDHRGEKDESAPLPAQVPVANQVDVSDKIRRRRKTELQKPQNLRDLGKFLNKKKPNLSNPSIHNGAHNLKVMLSNCLSNYRVRRRCAFEWFYSAIDYPWFAKREFVEYLNHVGLGHVPRLTRVEWGVIRSSLGKPRRFSEQFLKEEKEKLNQYRDSVREHYSELREGTREGLPTDLARPLSVGQRVMAIHPRTREIHDGNVLTVDHNRCRVQFDRPELGVEFVLDIDCMPSNPVENMPASIARNTVTMDKLFASFNELKMMGQSKDRQKLEGFIKFSTGETFEHVDVPSHGVPAHSWNNLLKQVKGSHASPNLQAKTGIHEATNGQPVVNSALLAQIQAKEADVQALAELTRALDKKEAVVSELRHMNDGVLENQREGDTALKDSESFKKQYAAVFVQLNAVNDQVSRALQDLRKHNTYIVNSPPSWPKITTVGDSGGPLNSFNSQANHVQESRSHVHEIVENSKRKARIMVDAATQAMSSFKIGGNSTDGIGDAIEYISKQLSVNDSIVGASRSFTPIDQINGNLISSDGLEFELKNVLDRNESQIPSELISHCVATLLMIQKCTERQFPPADVAEILDSAALSLQPRCSQNLVVYGEIQKCMGILRNQILGLIPT